MKRTQYWRMQNVQRERGQIIIKKKKKKERNMHLIQQQDREREKREIKRSPKAGYCTSFSWARPPPTCYDRLNGRVIAPDENENGLKAKVVYIILNGRASTKRKINSFRVGFSNIRNIAYVFISFFSLSLREASRANELCDCIEKIFVPSQNEFTLA